MNDFSVIQLTPQILKRLNRDNIIAFTYSEPDARRFSGMIDIATTDTKRITFYYCNYLHDELKITDFGGLLPLIRSRRLEHGINRLTGQEIVRQITAFDNAPFSLGAFSRTWAHYLIGDHRHLFINRNQEVFLEEIAAAVSENIAQIDVVPTVHDQRNYIHKYWRQVANDIFELNGAEAGHPTRTELRNTNVVSAQMIYFNNGITTVCSQRGNKYRVFETEVDHLGSDLQSLINQPAADNQAQLIVESDTKLEFLFHSRYFHFINNEWTHISLGQGNFMLLRIEFFDQAMRLCGYYRRQNLYQDIVEGKMLRRYNFPYLFDFYWRICALRTIPTREFAFKRNFLEELDVLPLTQHVYDLLTLEQNMDPTFDSSNIIETVRLVDDYLADIPVYSYKFDSSSADDEQKARYRDYIRRDKVLSAVILAKLPEEVLPRKHHYIRDVYGDEISDLVQKLRTADAYPTETQNLSHTAKLVIAASVVQKFSCSFRDALIGDFYKSSLLRSYLRSLNNILGDVQHYPYQVNIKADQRDALWFAQAARLRIQLDFLLDN